MPLKTQHVETVNKSVYRQFPEMAGSRPSVQPHAAPGAKSAGMETRHLLTYKARVPGPGGQSMMRVVRVVADEFGRILKISTSK